jgi:hypothetical protein
MMGRVSELPLGCHGPGCWRSAGPLPMWEADRGRRMRPVATLARRRGRQPPQRLGPYAAGSREAVALVRGFVIQQRRIRARGLAEAEIARREYSGRRRFV